MEVVHGVQTTMHELAWSSVYARFVGVEPINSGQLLLFVGKRFQLDAWGCSARSAC